jgi:hypothetical protein
MGRVKSSEWLGRICIFTQCGTKQQYVLPFSRLRLLRLIFDHGKGELYHRLRGRVVWMVTIALQWFHRRDAEFGQQSRSMLDIAAPENYIF